MILEEIRPAFRVRRDSRKRRFDSLGSRQAASWLRASATSLSATNQRSVAVAQRIRRYARPRRRPASPAFAPASRFAAMFSAFPPRAAFASRALPRPAAARTRVHRRLRSPGWRRRRREGWRGCGERRRRRRGVSKAVRMRGVEAPDDAAKSYVAKGNADVDRAGGPSRWMRRAFPSCTTRLPSSLLEQAGRRPAEALGRVSHPLRPFPDQRRDPQHRRRRRGAE